MNGRQQVIKIGKYYYVEDYASVSRNNQSIFGK